MSSARKKCVHVLATPDYAPELCAVTLPPLRAYAERIGADFNLIQERRFPDYPVNYERIQIYDAGKDYEWNINIDADMVVGRTLRDPTAEQSDDTVLICMAYDLTAHFHVEKEPLFDEQSSKQGIVDAFVVTSKRTHRLWEPLSGSFSDYIHLFKDDGYRRISEYCLSLNRVRHGWLLSGAFHRSDRIFHVGYTSGDVSDAAARATAKLREWGDI